MLILSDYLVGVCHSCARVATLHRVEYDTSSLRSSEWVRRVVRWCDECYARHRVVYRIPYQSAFDESVFAVRNHQWRRDAYRKRDDYMSRRVAGWAEHLATLEGGPHPLPETPPMGSLTCDDCPAQLECECAYDDYNTNGDCLASK